MKSILTIVLAFSLVLSLNSILSAQFIDTDGDGMADNVDDSPDSLNSSFFTDTELGGSTWGWVMNRDGLYVQIEDEPYPDGVLVSVSGGEPENIATLALLGTPPVSNIITSYFYLSADDQLVITNGSVSVDVISGIVSMSLIAEDGSEATVDLSENNSLTFEPTNGIFLVPATNTTEVVVIVNNVEITIAPGQSVYVDEGVVGDAISIDIKPGSEENCINNDGQGVIPVAILGSPALEVTQIDPASVQLEGLSVKIAGKSNKLLTHFENVNDDNYNDLVVQIEDADMTFEVGTTKATLTCFLKAEFGSALLKGMDNIQIVPPALPKQTIESTEQTTPQTFKLYSIAPNPFNPSTTISYLVAKSSHVKLAVYNTLGQVVAELVNGFQAQGSYSITWDAINQPSGLYLYRFETDGFTATKKMFLQK